MSSYLILYILQKWDNFDINESNTNLDLYLKEEILDETDDYVDVNNK